MKYALLALLAIVMLGVFLYARAYLGARTAQKRDAVAIASAKSFAMDFSTPEGAILCLEDAFRRKDLSAAVACKDFTAEARIMLKKLGKDHEADPEIVAKTAEALELSFRKHTAEAWPDFSGLQSFFVARERYDDATVVVTEVCRFPDGGTSRQQLLVTQTAKGWRVLNPL
jgi:hypothetical protein